jgi:hypothetical protein
MEAHQVSNFAAGDRCKACGGRYKSVLTLGPPFRQREIRGGRADPGLLCLGCAELWTNMLRTGTSKKLPHIDR